MWRTASVLLRDWFLWGLVGVVLAAWLWPEFGSDDGPLHPRLLNRVGVALVFLLHGARLPLSVFRAGVLKWRVHVMVQAVTFLVLPLVGAACFLVLRRTAWDVWALGVLYLSALPSTLSSATVLTATARGDVSVSVLNATLASLLGIVGTPLWIGLLWGRGGGSFALRDVVGELLVLLLLPLLVGQGLRGARPVFRSVTPAAWWVPPSTRERTGSRPAWLSRVSGMVRAVDRVVVLLILYAAFCNSLRQGVWGAGALEEVFASLIASLLLLVVAFATLTALLRQGGVDRAAARAAVFAGSTKSLAVGAPLSLVIFGDAWDVGRLLLPLMVYHPLQLFLGSLLAVRWASDDTRMDA